MEMEKQQYAKPILQELDMPMFVVCGDQSKPIDPSSPLDPDTEGEKTPDDVDVE